LTVEVVLALTVAAFERPAFTVVEVTWLATVVAFAAAVVDAVALAAACVVEFRPRFTCAKEKIDTPVATNVVKTVFTVFMVCFFLF
jgi:hypothetical protein